MLVTYWYKDRVGCGRILSKPVGRRGRKEWSSYPERGGSRFDKNNGEFLPYYMASCPRTQCFSLC
jgi:hypothetical protein